MTRYIPTADVAKLIRAQLKAKFPGIKFSVRSRTYAGGSSIDIGWTDGPTAAQVDAIAKPFAGGRFDGMIDMAYSVDSYLMPDGSAAVAHDPGTEGSGGCDPAFRQFKPHHDAERVHFGVSHVFAHREFSAGMKARTLDSLRARLAGVEEAARHVSIEDRHGRACLSHDPHVPEQNDYLSGLLHRALIRRTSVRAAA